MDFYILGNIGSYDETSPSGYTPPTVAETMAFPESPISTKKNDTRPFIGNYDILATNVKSYDTNFNGRGIGLLKDCREAISVNYNLRLITESDQFVLSPFVFLPQKKNVKLVLLSTEVNKLTNGYIDTGKIIYPYDEDGNQLDGYFDVSHFSYKEESPLSETRYIYPVIGISLFSYLHNVAKEHFTGENGYTKIKSIAIVCDVALNPDPTSKVVATIPNRTQLVMARNLPNNITKDDALDAWWIGSPKKSEVFKNKQ